jgi:hypothetical protein
VCFYYSIKCRRKLKNLAFSEYFRYNKTVFVFKLGEPSRGCFCLGQRPLENNHHQVDNFNGRSTHEELRRYRKRGLFNNERETTRAKFWRAKTSIACPYSQNDSKHIRCFCCCFFLSVKFFESCETTDNF